MPKTPSPAFWTIFGWMETAAKEFRLALSHNETFRVANAYILTLRGDDYNPLTYTDTTGEEACRRWLASQMKVAA